MSDLTLGTKYAVTTEHTFDGVFEGWEIRGGKRYAVFATAPSAGVPFRSSGRRYVLETAVSGLEPKGERA